MAVRRCFAATPHQSAAQTASPQGEAFMKGETIMDFYKVPIGFGMALAVNEPAMNAYAAMTEEQKQAILNKAHNARSEKEMYSLVASLANGTI